MRLQEIISKILKAPRQEFPRLFRFSIHPFDHFFHASFSDLISSCSLLNQLRKYLPFPPSPASLFFNSPLRGLNLGVRGYCPFFSCFEKSPPRRYRRTPTPVASLLPLPQSLLSFGSVATAPSIKKKNHTMRFGSFIRSLISFTALPLYFSDQFIHSLNSFNILTLTED